ncbi:unnamed protein product, partial [Urochloa humidicola]
IPYPSSQSLPADRDRSFSYSDQLQRNYPQAESTAMTTAASKVSIPTILLALSVLSCLLLVHAAAAGNRKALLPRGAAAGDVDAAYGSGGQAALPITAEEVALGAGGEPHHDQLAGDEEDVVEAARRAELLQTQDYPGSGANSRHDPRNPH